MQAYVVRRAALREDEDGRYTMSETGRLQAELLATHLARQPEPVEAVYTGTADRHHETVTVLSAVFEAVSGRETAVRELSALDDVPWSEEPLQYCIKESLGQRKWGRAWAEGDRDPDETPADVRSRVQDAKETVRGDHSEDATVCGHVGGAAARADDGRAGCVGDRDRPARQQHRSVRPTGGRSTPQCS